MGWDYDHWREMYTDLPSRQAKVPVADPKRVTTVWDETRALTPPALQEGIDQCVKAHGPSARAFVRPSGTEPVVRIYVEADTDDAANSLLAEVKAVIGRVLV
eukprot:TRINITY_DN4489_c0_g1_i1.p1 TRINITY_DN4489_c0_g1~~TRINITY_DN4489_c0_g1_i1.p1  ORF type:complete len:102 (+),score=22.01 TRINITY_DN4489_c0_g1_i1:800-1105(+)